MADEREDGRDAEGGSVTQGCDLEVIAVCYAEPASPNDPTCGCMNYGHIVNGAPCHHFDQCATHKLIELAEVLVCTMMSKKVP